MGLRSRTHVTTVTSAAGCTTTPTLHVHTVHHLETDAITSLTRREREVLALLCQRLTDAEIANVLSISPRTVECHVTRILGKLQARNRRDAAALVNWHGESMLWT